MWLLPERVSTNPSAVDRIQFVKGLQQPRGWGRPEDSDGSAGNLRMVSASTASRVSFQHPRSLPGSWGELD